MDYEKMVLQVSEEQDLAQQEEIIDRGLKTFVDVGNALMKIRDARLYRANFATFEDYCRERWGMRRMYAYRMINAANVVTNVSNLDTSVSHWDTKNVPSTESQARPLTSLEPEQQAEAWQKAVDTAPNGKVTAKHVKETVDKLYTEPEPTVEPEPWRPEPIERPVINPQPIEGSHPPTVEPEIVEPEIVTPSRMDVHFSSETPEHYTPEDFLFYVYECLGDVDLDPCSNSRENPNVNALNHFTKEDDGLAKDWFGKVYMNPPYGREITEWIDKLCSEYDKGNVTEAIALVPARTDTQWWKSINDNPFLLIEGRLKFGEAENSAPFPSAAFYLGDDPDLFRHCFTVLGGLGKVFIEYKPDNDA